MVFQVINALFNDFGFFEDTKCFLCLFLNPHLIGGAVYVVDGEHVEALFCRASRHVLQGFALAQQHFQDVALGNLRQFQLCPDECHRAMLFRNV